MIAGVSEMIAVSIYRGCVLQSAAYMYIEVYRTAQVLQLHLLCILYCTYTHSTCVCIIL